MADAEPTAIRAFIALELPEPVRAALHRCIDAARPDAPGKLSWTSPEKMHLTLAFLGASAPERLEALKPSLAEVAARHAAFALALGRPGVFPSPRRPSVLWIGVQASAELAKLQSEVAEACKAHGWELEDRPFAAHLTCARVKFAGPPNALASAWSKAPVDTVRWNADALSLMKSETRPEGARYTALANFTLREPAQ